MHNRTFLNYFALIVGYGTAVDDQKFWNVKTSLGTNWGEGGYIRIAKGTHKGPWNGYWGMCGVSMLTGFGIAQPLNYEN